MKSNKDLQEDMALAAAKASMVYLSDVRAMKIAISPKSQLKLVNLNKEPCEVVNLAEYRARRKKLI